MDDVLARSALDQSALLRAGQLSVEEITRLYLARIERLEPGIAAFAQRAPEQALAVARRMDRARARRPGDARGPLWGLPTGMKDVHFVRGMFMRAGSRALRWLWSPVDDVTTAAVRRAGMVIVGKLSTSELAILPIVDTELHPPTRTPWDRSRYAGGSSGGSAAAVAAGMLPIAVGSDGAGSIRIPAALCGLVGHKPSRGLLPNPFARFEKLEMSVVGPLARSVDDAAALLDVLGDGPPRGTSFVDAARRAPARLRVRFTTDNPVVPVERANADAVVRVARRLEDLGHTVEEGRPFAGSLDEFLPIFTFLAAGAWVPFESQLQPVTRWLRERGRRVPPTQARAGVAAFTARVDAWFEGVNLWLTPTVATAAPLVGTWRGANPETAFRGAAALGVYTAVFNASGHPATSIPVWPDGGGAPVGVQLVAPRGEDARTLALARALLEALGTPLCPTAPP